MASAGGSGGGGGGGSGSCKSHKLVPHPVPSEGSGCGGERTAARPGERSAAGPEAGGWPTWWDPEGNSGKLLGPEQNCLLGRRLQLSASD